jgi:hypothetical protein
MNSFIHYSRIRNKYCSTDSFELKMARRGNRSRPGGGGTIPTCGLPGCGNPCYVAQGIVHGYCGRSHAAEALSCGLLASLQEPHGKCHVCKLHGCNRQVFFEAETGRVHDFCGKKHADLARQRGQWEMSNGTAVCALDGCNQLVFQDPSTGRTYDYCGRTHAREAQSRVHGACRAAGCSKVAYVNMVGRPYLYCSTTCLLREGFEPGEGVCSLPGCVKQNFRDPVIGTEESFCSEEHRLRATVRQLGPVSEPHVERVFHGSFPGAPDEFRLMVLTRSHPDFKSVRDQFRIKWEKEGDPRVERIFKIMVPQTQYDAYCAYKLSAGPEHNLKRRFHGTGSSQYCNFFVTLGSGPCARSDCNVCSICQHGFSLEKVGQTARSTQFRLRYGEGLYFSSISGKSNDYASGSEKVERGRRYRAMLLCNVVVGRAFETFEGILDGALPPPGYDSVVGKVGPNLNYDEVVVYRSEAAIPAFLITYSMEM